MPRQSNLDPVALRDITLLGDNHDRSRLVPSHGPDPARTVAGLPAHRRNQRVLDAYAARQADNARRAAAGLLPKTRRRRKTLASLVAVRVAVMPVSWITSERKPHARGPSQAHTQ